MFPGTPFEDGSWIPGHGVLGAYTYFASRILSLVTSLRNTVKAAEFDHCESGGLKTGEDHQIPYGPRRVVGDFTLHASVLGFNTSNSAPGRFPEKPSYSAKHHFMSFNTHKKPKGGKALRKTEIRNKKSRYKNFLWCGNTVDGSLLHAEPWKRLHWNRSVWRLQIRPRLQFLAKNRTVNAAAKPAPSYWDAVSPTKPNYRLAGAGKLRYSFFPWFSMARFRGASCLSGTCSTGKSEFS